MLLSFAHGRVDEGFWIDEREFSPISHVNHWCVLQVTNTLGFHCSLYTVEPPSLWAKFQIFWCPSVKTDEIYCTGIKLHSSPSSTEKDKAGLWN